MKYIFTLLSCALLVLCACDQIEEAKTESSFWGTGATGKTTWPTHFEPTKNYKIEGTITHGEIENFLNIKENKISYNSFNAKTHFLAIQGLVYDKKNKTEKQLFDYYHRMESADSGTAYLYIALAPEEFEVDFFSSKNWKLYIQSSSEFSGNQQHGTSEQRMRIPNLAKGTNSISFSASPRTDSQQIPYIRVLDTDNFEIRIYSNLVEHPNRAKPDGAGLPHSRASNSTTS
ncbi:hypothetical protein QEH52_11945 [Coraliomargarita sp. SDUM461003]|uniref:Lipoprotein n=1 Tax=Thalassobacterium maritimum TaxID=3041265 RepID=A0ABU1AVQ2_9BACT|nr:hypothetical protein [Coraliomargarita sp. SDUM461003]MDQ8208225.1 hypothetical protein [Coraliomargarita sp. SDUM461003]